MRLKDKFAFNIMSLMTYTKLSTNINSLCCESLDTFYNGKDHRQQIWFCFFSIYKRRLFKERNLCIFGLVGYFIASLVVNETSSVSLHHRSSFFPSVQFFFLSLKLWSVAVISLCVDIFSICIPSYWFSPNFCLIMIICAHNLKKDKVM